MPISEKIKLLRKMKGFTQENFASLLGWPTAMVSQYESGKRSPSIANVIKLKKIFHCTYEWLLEEDFEPVQSGYQIIEALAAGDGEEKK